MGTSCFFERRQRYRAFTLVELLVVVTVIAILAALLLTSLTAARKSARRVQCVSNLRQVGLAASSFHSARGHFPPGYLGPLESDPLPPSGRVYGQAVGSLAFLLPFLEEEEFYVGIDLTLSRSLEDDAWWNNDSSWETAQQSIPIFLCPSDNPQDAEKTLASIHTYQKSATQPSLQMVNFSSEAGGSELGKTSYVGVAGGMGHTGIAAWDKYEGPFTKRSSVGMRQILDGSTHTLLFGESIGGLYDHERRYAHSWMGSGALPTAFGLGGTEWYRFSSVHPGIVHFCLADGSVHAVSVTIEDDLFMSLSGIHDGEEATLVEY